MTRIAGAMQRHGGETDAVNDGDIAALNSTYDDGDLPVFESWAPHGHGAPRVPANGTGMPATTSVPQLSQHENAARWRGGRDDGRAALHQPARPARLAAMNDRQTDPGRGHSANGDRMGRDDRPCPGRRHFPVHRLREPLALAGKRPERIVVGKPDDGLIVDAGCDQLGDQHLRQVRIGLGLAATGLRRVVPAAVVAEQ